ncbi:hypothetical protein CVT26_010912 [Gymnopilus dilepis]|uniref:chitinase n=1 Tax=Gymnopilus dilepis TaxID=231916 RepID=A0A409VIM8_9AGAR|nr:hypothetical protein CVT26_010912 [Gymnopilus dilepis]
MFSLPVILAGSLALGAAAFDNTRFDNVAVYWGQNSYGAANPSDPSHWQQRLSFYCNDNAVDVFPLAFLNVFFGTGGEPSLNLANTCNPTDNATFPGTELPNCSSLASDITTCQSKGKIITLSLGGATGGVGFSSASQATSFAQTIWNLFLGGSSSTRPFGSAVLDGVDLDIEGGGSAYYDSFVNEIRSLAAGASKKYYVTAAPQCVFPDANLGSVLNSANFDAVYVQYVGQFPECVSATQCITGSITITADFRILLKVLTGTSACGRDNWARTTSPNKNVKVYIGAPASSSAAGSGYVPIGTLSSIAVQMRKSFPSFGGVMLWDESQAYANNRFDLAIKNALSAAGGTGFTYPACTAPAWVAGTSYTAGSQVSFGGYIWQANYYATDQPASNPGGDWSAISACGGASSSPTSTKTTTTVSSTTTKSTTTTKSSSTSSSSPTTTPVSGSCAGVAAWSSGVAYQGGAQVVYNGHLWTAKWWSESDTPGGKAHVPQGTGPTTDRVHRTKQQRLHPRNPKNLLRLRLLSSLVSSGYDETDACTPCSAMFLARAERTMWVSICTLFLVLYANVAVVDAFSNERNDNVCPLIFLNFSSAIGVKILQTINRVSASTATMIRLMFSHLPSSTSSLAKEASPLLTSPIQGSNNFPGTDLADCSFMASDIKKCQAKGKLITLSLGGATAQVGFSSDSQASSFAKTIWNMFLGGNGAIRPFGNAVLDGVDLDIENGSPAHYNTFVNTLRSLSKNASKRYYITAAPQCPFPDAKVGDALNGASFDAVYVQFYNNFCETSAPSEFNFATWDHWAKTQSPNKDVKVYLGAPGSAGSAGNGYVSSQTLINVALDAQKRYSSFGGIMLWDADSAYTNNKYHATVKNAIRNRSEGPSNPSPQPNPSPAKPAPTTHAPNPAPSPTAVSHPAPVPSKSPSSVESPIPDPRFSGRVRRPTVSLEQRDASPAPTALGQSSPRRSSRHFRF